MTVKLILSYLSVSQIQVAHENDLLCEQFTIANADHLALARSTESLGICLPGSQVKVAYENDLLDEQFVFPSADDLALVKSIEELGIQEPLTLSADGILLSGYRRFAAAKVLKLEEVPVRFNDTVFSELSTTEKLSELRSFDQQGEKAPDKKFPEALIRIFPREGSSRKRYYRFIYNLCNTLSEDDAEKSRKRPRTTTTQFLKALQEVIPDNTDSWPLTVRRIHYLLLNDPPLRHDKKPNSRYRNDHKSYQALANLLIRGRLANVVLPDAIEDMARPIHLCDGFSSFQELTDVFSAGSPRGLMQGQPHYIEIILEKNALRLIIEEEARNYCIPVTSGRSFSSLSSRADLYARYRNSGCSKLILLMLTDFDPAGEQIAASFARSMRDDFCLKDISAIKVALTAEDVEKHNLPSNLDTKPSSPNCKKFVKKYGHKAVELEAAPVTLLQQKLRDAIESVIDVTEFNCQSALKTFQVSASKSFHLV
jgi:ParB-like nuclease family protein